MAEVRNVFIKSKMNKDLDERLLPPGEYRDGQNISVSKSEGPDEGVIENILGNALYSNFSFATGTEIIGVHVDTNKDRIFVFATNFSDGSPNQNVKIPSNVPTADGKVTDKANCYIAYIDGPLNSGSSSQNSDILVEGGFLNFSKTAPMLGMDMIEDLLFFTDNRNQPRKINVETAIAESATSTSPYYTNEDHISVAKYAPVEAIEFLDSSDNMGLLNQDSEWLPPSVTVPVIQFIQDDSGGGDGKKDYTVGTQIAPSGTFSSVTAGKLRGINLNLPELGYFLFKEQLTDYLGNWCRIEYPIGSGNTPSESMDAIKLAAENINADSSAEPFNPGDILQWEYKNPEYEATFDGDKNYLKDKFVRFSYRFKYDDNEHSLMAPFTQHAFIPKRFGYFCDSSYEPFSSLNTENPAYVPTTPLSNVVKHGNLKRDERDAAESGVVKFMENQVTTCKLKIPMPYEYLVDTSASNVKMAQVKLAEKLKVKSIQILIKESDGLAVKVVEEVDVNQENGFISGSKRYYEYIYKSNKPFKTLPESDTSRVHDKVPVLAAAQAVTSNRIVYGNYIEKLASPEFLDYDLGVNEKPDTSGSSPSSITKEYPNHTLKQNRSYKVGVVLMDRYGRSSNVILRRPNTSSSADLSSVYSSYEDIASPLNWRGNNLNIVFNNTIPTAIIPGGYPGVYETNDDAGFVNPTGYMSYKIVVQQQEQEYYNVLTPGATSGVITFNGVIEDVAQTGAPFNVPKYIRTNSTTNIALYGDNINKVPKELADVGPTEQIYGSSTLLYPRVVTKLIINTSNYPTAYGPEFSTSQSSQVNSLNEFTVKSILSFKDLGGWTETRNTTGQTISKANYPNSTGNQVKNSNILKDQFIDPIYLGGSSNPFVAQLETSFLVGYSAGVQDPKKDLSQQQPDVNQILPDFSKNLNVFETNPFVSKLEIFWETSSAGLIAELNEDIQTGTATLPDNISTINLQMNEALTVSSSSYVSDEFEVLDDSSAIITDGTCTMSVRDGNNAVSSNFQLEQTGTAPSKFRIKLLSEIPYLADVNLRTFNFTLTIGSATSTINKTLSRTLSVGNTNPFVLNPQAFVEVFDQTGNGKRNILFEGQNGNTASGATNYGSLLNPWVIVESPASNPGSNPDNTISTESVQASTSFQAVLARWTVNQDFFNSNGIGSFVNGVAAPSGNPVDQRSLQLNFTDETPSAPIIYTYPGQPNGSSPPNVQTYNGQPIVQDFYTISSITASGGGFDLKLKNDWAYTLTSQFGPGFDLLFKFIMKVTDANNLGGEVYYSAYFKVTQQASGYTGPCWVAREVYGINNRKWLLFRNYLFNESPSWFKNIYIKYGEKFANFISNKPLLKSIIKLWMNKKIKNT